VRCSAGEPDSRPEVLRRVLSLAPHLGNQTRTLSEACRFGNADVARLLVEAGVPVDTEEVVFGAFVSKDAAVLELVLPQLRTERYVARNMHLLFPHDYSYYYDRHRGAEFARLYAEQERRLPAALALLLERFPDLLHRRVRASRGRVRGVGETLLEMACDSKSPFLVSFLLERGAPRTPACARLVRAPLRVPRAIPHEDLPARIDACLLKLC